MKKLIFVIEILLWAVALFLLIEIGTGEILHLIKRLFSG